MDVFPEVKKRNLKTEALLLQQWHEPGKPQLADSTPLPPCHNQHTRNQLSIEDQDLSQSDAMGDGKSSARTLPPPPVSRRDDKEALAHYFKVKPAFPELIEAGIRQCLGDYEKQLPLQVNS